MVQITRNSRVVSMGLDLGDRYSYLVAIQHDGEVSSKERVVTTRDAFRERFSQIARGTRVVCEAGTHSPWVSALLEELGLQCVVANPVCAGRALAANGRKNDQLDALTLASFGMESLRLLRPIKHRNRSAQDDLSVVRARDVLVRSRTSLINAVRGLVKSSGERLPRCSAPAFHHKVAEHVPEGLKPAILPLLAQIKQMTGAIREFEKQIDALCAKYPETGKLREITGVGALTALAYVLTLEDHRRFAKSRKVGAFLGLVPKERDSGAISPQLRITKCGDQYLRRLLVGSAHYILGPFGEDCDLRRFGERLASRGAARGKKQAVVAVARKLAVLMHRLWSSGQSYDPFYNTEPTKRRHA